MNFIAYLQTVFSIVYTIVTRKSSEFVQAHNGLLRSGAVFAPFLEAAMLYSAEAGSALDIGHFA
jgi:hypothetical protein